MRYIFSTLAVVFVLEFGFSSIVAAQPRDVSAQSVNTVDDVRRDGRDGIASNSSSFTDAGAS